MIVSKPKTVKLYKLDWGQEFEFPDDDTHTIYTLDRGNGMYPWVNDPSGHRFSVYMGEKVIPL
jgi:hypothetical protein